MAQEGDSYTNCDCYTWNTHQGIGEGTENIAKLKLVETIQTTTLLRSARILRRVLETCRNLMSSKLQ